MIFGNTAQELDSWRTQMKTYEKNKRTKKPFGNSVPKISHITYQQVKQKEVKFNPVLQNYKHQQDQKQRNQKEHMVRTQSLMNHFRQNNKYQRAYDIVNLHGNKQAEKTSNKQLGPVRNAYNVINNQKLPDFHFQNREMRVPVEKQKNLIANNQKQFNIVTNIYNQDHDYKTKQQQDSQKQYIYDKYAKTHDYDPVFGKFYDTQREKLYQQERKIREKEHGIDYDKKLPPSYVFREPYIPDPSKSLPDSLQTLDERRANARKRYQLKYIIEDEYNRRNFEDEDKKEKVIVNKVHVGRVEEEKSKQFNIISQKDYPTTRAQQLYRKPIVKSSWAQLTSATGKFAPIKTGGFN